MSGATDLLSRPGTKRRRMEDLVLAEIQRREARDRAAERSGNEFERELPTNIRFLFYEFRQSGIVRKRPAGPWRRGDQDLSDAVTRLRDRGIIPWNYITDEMRTYTDNLHDDTLRACAEDAVTYGSINTWQST